MLTKLEQKILDFVLYVSCQMFTFPHDWKVVEHSDKGRLEKKFQPTKSRIKIFGVYLNIGISLGYAIFLIYQLLPSSGVYSKEELKESFSFELLIHYLWLSSHCTSLVIYYFGLKYSREFSWFYNELTKFNQTTGKPSFCKLLV